MVGLQLVVVHWAPAQAVLDTVDLTLADWMVATVIASSVLLFDEVRKLAERIVRRRLSAHDAARVAGPAGPSWLGRPFGTRNDDERYVYFFGTPQLDLLQAGIVARARRGGGDEHDSTIKFRPVDPAKVGRKWRKFKDFKIEADASEKSVVKSASFSMPVTKGLIKRLVARDKGIAALFTEEQEEFLKEMSARLPDLSKLSVLGPLRAQRWDFEDPACPWPITAELWRRGDGATLMEVSVKAPAVQGAAVMAGFLAFLAEVGAERDSDQQAKTHWAVDYYAARLRRKAAAPAAAKPAGKRARRKTT